MDKQLEQLRLDLYSSNTDHRVNAVRQLGEQRVWGALEELVHLLEADEFGFSVAQALTAFGPEICKRGELEYMLLHPKKEVRYRAAWVYASFGDKRAVRALQDALQEWFFYEQFLPMLKRLGAPNLDGLMTSELSKHRESTEHPAARYRAVTFLRALTQMHSPAALLLAPHFLGERHDPLVRQHAQQYLSTLAPDRGTQAG
jgi:HEAT repeat protein